MTKRLPVSKKRSIYKSITFRILIIAMDLVVIYLLTHRIDTTLGITVISNISSTFLYFIHERIWNTVDLN